MWAGRRYRPIGDEKEPKRGRVSRMWERPDRPLAGCGNAQTEPLAVGTPRPLDTLAVGTPRSRDEKESKRGAGESDVGTPRQTTSCGNAQTASCGNAQTASYGNAQTASCANAQTAGCGNAQTAGCGNAHTAGLGPLLLLYDVMMAWFGLAVTFMLITY